MKELLTIQKIAPFSKASFPILRKTWYLNYLNHQMSLLNLKSHPTMMILRFKDLNFEFSETSPEEILNTLKSLYPSKTASIDNVFN